MSGMPAVAPDRPRRPPMLDPKLLEILACPKCRGPVVPDEKHAWLTCRACAVRY
ncbi:MAG: Trm112 family protein, partial [Candidatus Krumholzibacteriia bacterium]